jgi:hypothetical protein
MRPELVAEVTFLTWTANGFLRQVVFQGIAGGQTAKALGLTLAPILIARADEVIE